MRNNGHRLGAVVVGAGPGGFGLLFAARQAGLLDELRSAGIRILERSSSLGAGAIGQYDIRSDSHADSFLRRSTRTSCRICAIC
jgi:cation diffusion facilitator CzcD-associated flavoprotein CzcO